MCKVTIKPESYKLPTTGLKPEKNADHKNCYNQLVALYALKEALTNCEIPAFVLIDLDFTQMDLETRDKCSTAATPLILELSNAFAKKYDNGISAIVTTEGESKKRSRRQAGVC